VRISKAGRVHFARILQDQLLHLEERLPVGVGVGEHARLLTRAPRPLLASVRVAVTEQTRRTNMAHIMRILQSTDATAAALMATKAKQTTEDLVCAARAAGRTSILPCTPSSESRSKSDTTPTCSRRPAGLVRTQVAVEHTRRTLRLAQGAALALVDHKPRA